MTEALLIVGFPAYMTVVLGVGYFIGVACIWQPWVPFRQEWAWGGLMISLVGAAVAHIYTGVADATSALVLQIIVMFTYLLRTYNAQHTQPAAA